MQTLRSRRVEEGRSSRGNARLVMGCLTALAVGSLALPQQALAIQTRYETVKAPLRAAKDMAPVPAAQSKHTHAPFQPGRCGICHVKNDDKNPGGLRHASVNEECLECHEDTREVMSRTYKHYPSVVSCNYCHNPHNSVEPGLLLAKAEELCWECHKGLHKAVATAKVKHDALTEGKRCSNCHNPHASKVDRMLISLPFDLCVNCHSKDGMVSSDGKAMPNSKLWLGQNKVWHAPVQAKDCSACHRTHGGDNYRLLVNGYPAAFYKDYDPKNYALCYGCHSERVVSEPETTTLTGFRDGSRNLHYTHVHRDRGRSCRACHEVHAAKQERRVRDGVPFGSKGWILPINFTKTSTGGTCARTCHDTRSYSRTLTKAVDAHAAAEK